jgi:hypothetical protein
MMTAQPAPRRVPIIAISRCWLFWPEIYSDAHPVRRRNPGFPVIGPWKKQAKQPLFSAVSVKQYDAAIRDMYKPLRLAARLISNDTKPIVACQFNKCK